MLLRETLQCCIGYQEWKSVSFEFSRALPSPKWSERRIFARKVDSRCQCLRPPSLAYRAVCTRNLKISLFVLVLQASIGSRNFFWEIYKTVLLQLMSAGDMAKRSKTLCLYSSAFFSLRVLLVWTAWRSGSFLTSEFALVSFKLSSMLASCSPSSSAR